MTLTWVKVESSNIDSLSHDGTDMYVRFRNGSVYRYQGVPNPVYTDIRSASSIGSTFNSLVRSKPEQYPFERVV